MATSTDDLLRIHSRFPILAFFMSLCNPSTISTSITSSPTIIRPIQSTRSVGLRAHLEHGISIPFTKIRFSISFWQHDLVIHILASLVVVMIVWQTVVLGHKGVIVYACWTSHNPITWVCVAGIFHLLRILTWRLCLGPVSTPTLSNQTKAKRVNPRWCWRLSPEAAGHLEIRHPRMARFLATIFQITGVMNYAYGTLLFSGFTLVAPYYAMRTFTLIGFSSLVSRIIALWLLEVYPDVPVPRVTSDEIEMVNRGVVTSRPVDGYVQFDNESPFGGPRLAAVRLAAVRAAALLWKPFNTAPSGRLNT